MPRSGNVSVVGGVHSFAVSYLKTVNGTVEAKDVDLPYFYICPLSEGALTVRCLNQNEDVVLPAALYEVIDREHSGTLVDPIPYTPPNGNFSAGNITSKTGCCIFALGIVDNRSPIIWKIW